MGACFVFDVRCEYLDALSIKEASFVIDVRFESLEALHFKGACFVIDFRSESLEAIILMVAFFQNFEFSSLQICPSYDLSLLES